MSPQDKVRKFIRWNKAQKGSTLKSQKAVALHLGVSENGLNGWLKERPGYRLWEKVADLAALLDLSQAEFEDPEVDWSPPPHGAALSILGARPPAGAEDDPLLEALSRLGVGFDELRGRYADLLQQYLELKGSAPPPRPLGPGGGEGSAPKSVRPRREGGGDKDSRGGHETLPAMAIAG